LSDHKISTYPCYSLKNALKYLYHLWNSSQTQNKYHRIEICLQILIAWASKTMYNIPNQIAEFLAPLYYDLLFPNVKHKDFSTLTLIFNQSLLHCWLNSPWLLTAFLVVFIHLKYLCWCPILLFKGSLFKVKSEIIVTWMLGCSGVPCLWSALPPENP
jgi:hypothetical protein